MHPSNSKFYASPSDDLSELERSLLSHLNSGPSDPLARRELGLVLEFIFRDAQRSVGGSGGFSDWNSDGFAVYESGTFSPTHVRLSGRCYWLDGGDGCDRYVFDLDPSRQPLRYSFKFVGGRRERQGLYVAKTDDGWYANAT